MGPRREGHRQQRSSARPGFLALDSLSIKVGAVHRALESELKFNWEGTPVHFFFSCDPLHEVMERGVRMVPLGGGTLPLIAPEHLVIRKTLLGRPKDQRDIEQIAATVDLDWEEIEDWVRRLRTSQSRAISSDLCKLAIGRIVLTDETRDYLDCRIDILWRGLRYLLDISPVSGSCEQSLEDDQRCAI